MALDQSDYIALAAFGVSALSALYARWAVTEAKKANKISLHAHKIEIYEEVVSFSDCFRGFLTVPSSERLEKFKKLAVQRAELYLSNEVYLQLKEIYEHCNESEIWLSIAENEPVLEGTPNHLEVRQEYKSVLNLLYPVIEMIKVEARINDA